MREIRQSGSEGGGTKPIASPYPYQKIPTRISSVWSGLLRLLHRQKLPRLDSLRFIGSSLAKYSAVGASDKLTSNLIQHKLCWKRFSHFKE